MPRDRHHPNATSLLVQFEPDEGNAECAVDVRGHAAGTLGWVEIDGHWYEAIVKPIGRRLCYILYVELLRTDGLGW